MPFASARTGWLADEPVTNRKNRINFQRFPGGHAVLSRTDQPQGDYDTYDLFMCSYLFAESFPCINISINAVHGGMQ